MNEQTSQSETCLCRDAVRKIAGLLRVPEETRQHLTNSRVEFLRAVRSLIDARIEHLQRGSRKGSQITVE